MKTAEMVAPETSTSAIAEYSHTAAALAELRERLSNIAYDVTTGKGMAVAVRDRAEVRDLRVALEKKRVQLKAPALERSRLIDAEAKRITLELEALEKPIDEQIKAEEAAKEAAKQARINAEFGRVQAIQDAIGEIHMVAMSAAGKSSAFIAETIATMRAEPLDPQVFQEMLPQAVAARDAALTKLDTAHRAKLHDEAEASKVAAERAELAQLREAVAAQKLKDEAAKAAAVQAAWVKAEAERVAAAAEQKRLDAEAAAARAEADKAAAAARAIAQAEHEAQMKAEREAAAEVARVNAEKAAKALAKQRKAEADEKRMRDAAATMLAALREVRPMVTDQDGLTIIDAAVKEATGE